MSLLANPPIDAVRSRAGRVILWWLNELRALWVDAARRFATITGNDLRIEAGERRWIVRRGARRLGDIEPPSGTDEAGRRALRDLAASAGRRALITIEIPAERVLSKIVDLPDAARHELDRVVRFEIARHFPFPAERVFHRHRIVSPAVGARETRATALSVEIVIVPRDVVTAIVSELAAAKLRVSSIALAASGNRPPLFLSADAAGRELTMPTARRRLAIVTMLLGLTALVSWPVAQQVRLAALEHEIAALKPGAEAVLRLRRAQQRDADQAIEIARLRAGRPPLIALLESLSREVPDGSWLTSLSITGHELLVEGLSPSSATIALALGRNPNFTSVAFRAPITRDVASGSEHFQLGAMLTEPRQ